MLQNKIVIGTALIIISFLTGWKVHAWKIDAAEKVRVAEQLELQIAYDVLAREVISKYNKTEAVTTIVYRDIKRKINDVTDNRICFADSNALSMWNNALSGLPTTSPGIIKTSSGTSTVTDKQLLENSIENFEQYKQLRDQMNSLIDWYELTYHLETN